MNRGMKAIRLYIISDDDSEVTMRVAYELLSFGNKLVRISCGNEIVNEGCVIEKLFEMCIDELEFIMCSDFDAVINELEYILAKENYEVAMEFIIEVEDGYIYLMPEDVKRIVDGEEEEYVEK